MDWQQPQPALQVRDSAMSVLRRDFCSREELSGYLRRLLPAADGEASAVRGGRAAAVEAMERFDPRPYAATRNHLDGAVSRLSMYIRHGVLSLAEVREAAIHKAGDAQQMAKFVQELAWRDYWQRVWRHIGDGIWEDQEPYKTGWGPEDYAPHLPADIEEDRIGLACMDSFSRELRQTGYLHNHARM